MAGTDNARVRTVLYAMWSRMALDHFDRELKEGRPYFVMASTEANADRQRTKGNGTSTFELVERWNWIYYSLVIVRPKRGVEVARKVARVRATYNSGSSPRASDGQALDHTSEQPELRHCRGGGQETLLAGIDHRQADRRGG